MHMETVLHLLVWCTVIHFVILLVWWILFMLPHQWVYRLCKGLGVSEETFNSHALLCMWIYKIGIILFNLVPLIAVLIVR